VETTILILMEYARQKGKPVDCVRKWTTSLVVAGLLIEILNPM
jgi:hypothetical protein